MNTDLLPLIVWFVYAASWLVAAAVILARRQGRRRQLAFLTGNLRSVLQAMERRDYAVVEPVRRALPVR